jgi:hypothetical protein
MKNKLKVLFNSLYIIPLFFVEFYKLIFNFVSYKTSQKFVQTNADIKTISIKDIFDNFNESIESYTNLADTSLPIDIAFIKSIIKSKENVDYLEIGSFRGESLVNVIPYTNSTYSISLGKEELYSICKNQDFVEVESILLNKTYCNFTKIDHNSQTFDFESLNKKFDVIFVDGDHSENGVYLDTKNVFKLLKNEESVIIWHDFGHSPSDYRYDVIAGALKGMPKEEWGSIYRVRNTLCGIYSKKNILSTLDKNIYKPNATFKVHFEIEKSI